MFVVSYLLCLAGHGWAKDPHCDVSGRQNWKKVQSKSKSSLLLSPELRRNTTNAVEITQCPDSPRSVNWFFFFAFTTSSSSFFPFLVIMFFFVALLYLLSWNVWSQGLSYQSLRKWHWCAMRRILRRWCSLIFAPTACTTTHNQRCHGCHCKHQWHR